MVTCCVVDLHVVNLYLYNVTLLILSVILPYLMDLYEIENEITFNHLGFDFNLVKGLAQSSQVNLVMHLFRFAEFLTQGHGKLLE